MLHGCHLQPSWQDCQEYVKMLHATVSLPSPRHASRVSLSHGVSHANLSWSDTPSHDEGRPVEHSLMKGLIWLCHSSMSANA